MIFDILSTTPHPKRRWGSATHDRGTRAAVLLTLLSLATSGFAETAYSALRIVSARRGEEIFQRVIEMRGDGKPEPTTWKIVLADPRARAGVREIEVRKGHITSDSAPKKPRSANTPMDLSLLNLDSEGVLAVVDQQQTEATADPQQISYTLSNGKESGTPVWVVKFSPPSKATPTSLEIAADTGEIIVKAAAPPVADDRQILSDNEAPAEIDPATTDPIQGEDGLVNEQENKPKKPSSPHYREDHGDVPELAKGLARRAAAKPIRILRHFLP
jgi:hypothetical protein